MDSSVESIVLECNRVIGCCGLLLRYYLKEISKNEMAVL